tara:strand:+ start:57 stop:494 length:438 start_codon:yes stop_codon:yes gene_type:complete
MKTDLLYGILFNLLGGIISISLFGYILSKNKKGQYKKTIIITLYATLILSLLKPLVNQPKWLDQTISFSLIISGILTISFYLKRFFRKKNKKILDYLKSVFYPSVLLWFYFKINHYPYVDILGLVALITVIPIVISQIKLSLTHR